MGFMAPVMKALPPPVPDFMKSLPGVSQLQNQVERITPKPLRALAKPEETMSNIHGKATDWLADRF